MKENKKPSLKFSWISLVAILSVLAIGRFVFKINLHVIMLLTILAATASAKILGYKWDEIENAMYDQIRRSFGSIGIFFMIGAIVGSFIASGTVPGLIYYGLKLINPKFFLPAGLLICSITSMATGTSWGTIGTMGLAFMAIGSGLGIPAPMTAGMVVSGAFFGDKMSPLSDSTNLVPAVVEADLYDHIRAMAKTAVPAYIISLGITTAIGLQYGGDNVAFEQVDLMQTALNDMFNLNPIVFLPLIVILVMSVMKIPALPAMISGVVIATVVAIFVQGTELVTALAAINYGFTSSTGVEMIDTLLSRGGIQSMMWTISLVIFALGLGGIMDEISILDVIVENLTKKVKTPGGLMTMTILTSAFTTMGTAVLYFSLVLNGRLYKKSYEKAGLHKSMLTRAVEEGGTMSDPLIPWTTSGIFISGLLGVNTIEYLPYCFNNLITPVLSIVLCYLGFTIIRADDKVDEEMAMEQE